MLHILKCISGCLIFHIIDGLLGMSDFFIAMIHNLVVFYG